MKNAHIVPGNRSRRRARQARSLLYVIATLVVLGTIGGGVWYYLQNDSAPKQAQPLTTQVISAPFEHTVIEQGEVESSDNVEIRSQVKSQNAGGVEILWVVTEGKFVEEGEELVRLDSSALEKELDQQKIVTNTSLALKVQAENTYKAATIARTEYLEGTFQQEKQLIQSEIFVAEENLRRATEYAKHSERLAAKGYQTSLQLEGDRFAVDKAKNERELAKRKLFVLENYTREKTLRTLESDIATAQAKWDAEEQSYALEQKKLKDIERQISLCTINAPQAGQVVHANVPNSRGGTAEFIVEAGSKVREGQTIVRIPDKRKMQVKAKVNESRITNIRPGQPVTVLIEALGDNSVLAGVVKRVNSFAEPSSWFSSSVKQYATEITILDPPENIRSGLTAEVRIHVEQLPAAIQVPVQSIVETGGKTYVLAQNGESWEPQEVVIGSTNDTFVRIESGVMADQIVATNPRQHLNLFPFLTNGKLEPSVPKMSPTQNAAVQSVANNVATDLRAAGPRDRGPREGAQRRPAGGSMFKEFDADNDGKLTADELPSTLRDRLTDMDTNADGVVDQDELNAAMSRFRNARGGPPMPESGVGQ